VPIKPNQGLVSATHPSSRFEPQGLFGPVATRGPALHSQEERETIPIIVGTNRVDSTRRRRALIWLDNEGAPRSARVGTMIWTSRAALGAGGRNGTNRVVHKRDDEPYRAGP
jgi:hypothetical protein